MIERVERFLGLNKLTRRKYEEILKEDPEKLKNKLGKRWDFFKEHFLDNQNRTPRDCADFLIYEEKIRRLAKKGV